MKRLQVKNEWKKEITC